MRGIVIVGATQGIGLELAKECARRGENVTTTGRDGVRAQQVAAEVAREVSNGCSISGLGLDLSKPHAISEALSPIGAIDHIVIAGMVRDMNTINDFNIDAGINLSITKIVGYATVVHELKDRLSLEGSVLPFGGRAKDLPYPGSTTVSAVNGAIVGLVRTSAAEIAPPMTAFASMDDCAPGPRAMRRGGTPS